MKPIIIVGAGGYAQEVVWVIDDINKNHPTWECIGFLDPAQPYRKGKTLYDLPILGGFEDVKHLSGSLCFACGIGDPRARKRECTRAEESGWIPTSLLHPTVVVARHVELGEGTIVGAGSILAPYARIGRNCAINTQVTVGHNSIIGDYSVLAPGSRISGNARLEEGVFIGTNGTVYLGRTLGAWSSLGANSFLINNLKPEKSAIGVPARVFSDSTGAGSCDQQEERNPS